MKKTFLLLLSIGTLSSVFAQDGRYHDDRNNSKDVVLGRNDHQTVYNNTPVRDDHRNVPYVDYRRRDEEIARVSADYNRRIDAVQWDRRLRSKEKAREINRLQREKEQAIRDINERYERQRFGHNRH